MTNPLLTVVDGTVIPWEERYNERIGRALFRKELFVEPETGMEIRLVRYPSGVMNPCHTHPCGHGMYILEGTLVTHAGNYGPGTFVWFPEGQVMEHGSSAPNVGRPRSKLSIHPSANHAKMILCIRSTCSLNAFVRRSTVAN